MELKQLKELMAAMQRTGTKRVVIKKEGVEVEVEREDNGQKTASSSLDLIDDNPLRHQIALHRADLLLSRGGEFATAHHHPIPSSPAGLEPKPTQETETTPGLYVKAPMVGTYYAAPSPGDPAFVKLGDKVEKDTVVCIIEAMKVMNEIKAGVTGTVSEILIQTGHPVEFGTKLFKIT